MHEEELFKREHVVVIAPIQPAELDGLLAVHEQNLIANKTLLSDQELSDQGFLIHPFAPEEIELIRNYPERSIALVAREDSDIVGYIISFSLDEWKRMKPAWMATVEISKAEQEVTHDAKTLYVYQVARTPSHHGKDIGRKLEEELFCEADKRGYKYIIAEVLDLPIQNRVSIAMHHELGYVRIGSVHEGEHMLWGLWKKDLAAEPDKIH